MTVNLNIDPEVLTAATAIAKQSGRSVGEVVSELAKKGLGSTVEPQPATVRIEQRNGLAVGVIDPPPPPIDPEVIRAELQEFGP